MLSVRVSMEFHAYEIVSNVFHSTFLLFYLFLCHIILFFYVGVINIILYSYLNYCYH
jgi:hypothetical protein